MKFESKAKEKELTRNNFSRPITKKSARPNHKWPDTDPSR